jgi:DNA-binding transcriptional MerR regulator
VSRPARTPGGYRIYQERHIADLEFIQKAQEPGFSLSEVHELVAIRRHPKEVCTQVRDLIAQKLSVVRAKIAQLQSLEIELPKALRRCRDAAQRVGASRIGTRARRWNRLKSDVRTEAIDLGGVKIAAQLSVRS